jgi:hypothetical protein
VTDEEYSEFAECLESACQDRIANGATICPWSERYLTGDRCCPMGALLGVRFPYGGEECEPIVPRNIASGFIRGFDASPWGPDNSDPVAFDLGSQFRARYVTGAES